VRWAAEGGARRALLVPGDCPALDPREVDDLLHRPPGGAACHGRPRSPWHGTNALVLTPPAAIAPSFGPGSRARHEQARARRPASHAGRRAASLVLDVDTADDLAALRAALAGRPGAPPHARLLARLGRR
jgi:2-phospho-L-lactate guanylyltransferase